jgi:hypothetical protein
MSINIVYEPCHLPRSMLLITNQKWKECSWAQVKKSGKKSSDVLYWFQQAVTREETASFDSYVVSSQIIITIIIFIFHKLLGACREPVHPVPQIIP